MDLGQLLAPGERYPFSAAGEQVTNTLKLYFDKALFNSRCSLLNDLGLRKKGVLCMCKHATQHGTNSSRAKTHRDDLLDLLEQQAMEHLGLLSGSAVIVIYCVGLDAIKSLCLL